MARLKIKQLPIFMIVAFALALTAFNSCTSNAENKAKLEAAEKQRKDSIANAERIRDAKEDSLAIYAWGDVRFGMSKEEALKTKAFSGAEQKALQLRFDYDKRNAFSRGFGLKNTPEVYLDFGGADNNEVVAVTIEISADYENYNQLIHDMQALFDEFFNKYGKPYQDDVDIQSITAATFYDNGSDKIEFANWSIGSSIGKNGSKFITMGMVRDHSTGRYGGIVKIQNFAFPRNEKERTAEEIEADKKADKLLNEVKENSF